MLTTAKINSYRCWHCANQQIWPLLVQNLPYNGQRNSATHLYIYHADILLLFNPKCANRNKSRLLFSSAEMSKMPLWQTVWIPIRLLLCEQSVLGPRCLLLYLIRQ